MKDFEFEIETLTLMPADEGRFEVVVDGRLIYSKLATGRHANPGEINQLVQKQAR